MKSFCILLLSDNVFLEKEDKQNVFRSISQQIGFVYKRLSNEAFKLLRCHTFKDVIIKGKLFYSYL